MAKEHAGFDPCASAEADNLRILADGSRHFRAMHAQDLRLSASNIIFGQLANLLEQVGAALVVEKFRGQGFRRAEKALDNFGEKIGRGRLEVEHRHATGVTVHSRSRARRRPVNCQRFSGWKKFR